MTGWASADAETPYKTARRGSRAQIYRFCADRARLRHLSATEQIGGSARGEELLTVRLYGLDGGRLSLPRRAVQGAYPAHTLRSYVKDRSAGSRSAAVHKAVGLLRTAQLADAYEDAWASWASSQDAAAWDSAAADGLER